MLKRIQKVRDLVEEVTYVYADLDFSLRDYIREASGDTASFDFVTQACAEIEEMCNDMLHKDIGFCEYLEVHKKVYQLLAYITCSTSQVLNEWIAQLYNADDSCCRFVFNIMNV